MTLGSAIIAPHTGIISRLLNDWFDTIIVVEYLK
jgi:hypothetical protein